MSVSACNMKGDGEGACLTTNFFKNSFDSNKYDVLKSTSVQHKGKFYQKVVLKRNVKGESRSLSLPQGLGEKNANNMSECCDTSVNLLNNDSDSPPESPVNDVWFKTWPERYEKVRTESPENSLSNNSKNISISDIGNNKHRDIVTLNGNLPKLTLNEALQNISLAYSPITKQLHLLDDKNNEKVKEKSDVEKIDTGSIDTVKIDSQKIGDRRNDPGSFSSTISSLSDPSPSGSLLNDDGSTISDEFNFKPKKKGLSSFFTRNFSWKSAITPPQADEPQNAANSSVLWKIFSKYNNSSNTNQNSPKHDVIGGSSALIQHVRPSNLPAKTKEEEEKHREEYKAILQAAKKKEFQNNLIKQKQQKLQLELEEQQSLSAKHFVNNVLPNFELMQNNKKTRELWWCGIPPNVRGKIWKLSIGNELNITQQLYEICLSRAQNRLNSPVSSNFELDFDQESSMDLIQLDISRTFPNLCIFQIGGPYSEILHSLLAAYVCYRPDVGYIQGMSYIAAILILNMDPFDAFVCFANLLNKPLHLAAFTLNQAQMQAYYNAYNEIFNYNLPKLYGHFQNSGLTPDLYLLDWIYTVFAKAMPLDVTCRVWDVFLRDGDEFIFKTALGILHANQDLLMKMDFLHGAQFLTKLPEDLSADQLFKSIQSICTTLGKMQFSQIVEKHSSSSSLEC